MCVSARMVLTKKHSDLLKSVAARGDARFCVLAQRKP